ncbi:hypothetical protein FA13DRAFT_995889 [Coprinellus micaceus]|uniref:Uncharacterized protein n=1 Tax=Coprinellus micaceus TaxID=71717 RepID=A0A4Y7SY93_COPMI|nr:hypothetical protein FA13DRAFT_995889 [Coprinellus micaceus]
MDDGGEARDVGRCLFVRGHARQIPPIPVPISHLPPAPLPLLRPGAPQMSGKAIPTGPRALLVSTSSASSSTPASSHSQAINHTQRPPPTGPGSTKRIPTGPRSLLYGPRTAGPSSRPFNGTAYSSALSTSGPSAPPNGVDSQTNGRLPSPTMNGKKPEVPASTPSSQVKAVC